MRKNRVVEQNRCYHLVSRLAHRAFFLDDEEKDRAVRLKRRIYFSRYYVTPQMEKSIMERTDPVSPKSPRQEYRLA